MLVAGELEVDGMTDIKVPDVFGALYRVLCDLGVEKNGSLPSSMGGKPYMTAYDLSSAVKKLFVEQGLVILPSERLVKHEVIIFKDRQSVSVAVEGSYTVLAVSDGSSTTIGGVGDGLANGTAVASNIASTNALKNALLRTFLVTEPATEEAGLVPDSGGSAPKRVTPAGQKIAKATAVDPVVQELRSEVRVKYVENPASPYTRDQVNKLWGAVAAGGDKSTAPVLSELLRRLEAGEVE
jgi:hypothetical protein